MVSIMLEASLIIPFFESHFSTSTFQAAHLVKISILLTSFDKVSTSHSNAHLNPYIPGVRKPIVSFLSILVTGGCKSVCVREMFV